MCFISSTFAGFIDAACFNQAKWSAHIHEEWIRNVLKSRPEITRKQLEVVRDLMDEHAQDALVLGYESLIPSINLPDEGDKHVLAAAIVSSACVIVTCNLKDFPSTVLNQYGIEARHPDEFIRHLLDIHPAVVCSAVKDCCKRLKNPSLSVEEYLNAMERQSLVSLAKKLREFASLL